MSRKIIGSQDFLFLIYQLPLFISAFTSSSVGGLRGSGKRDIAMPEQALAKRTSSSSDIRIGFHMIPPCNCRI